jgi:hypothetical protein
MTCDYALGFDFVSFLVVIASECSHSLNFLVNF